VAESVVIPVFDPNYVKHYAFLPTDPGHRLYYTKATYCGEDAGYWELAAPVEELRELVIQFLNGSASIANQLNMEINKKAALFLNEAMKRMSVQVRTVLEHHGKICAKCRDEMKDRITE